MASYTVTGHPLNYSTLGLSQANQEAVCVALWNNGVGASVTLTLSGPDDTKVKGHGKATITLDQGAVLDAINHARSAGFGLSRAVSYPVSGDPPPK